MTATTPESAPRPETLLQVQELKLQFDTPRGALRAIEGVSFEVAPGECVGIVGESGCGKSMTARAVMGLVPEPGKIKGGRVLFEGHDLLALSPREWRKVRGRKVALVFQEAKRALDPTATVGSQIVEAIQLARNVSRGTAEEEAQQALGLVGLPDAQRVMQSYANELSGGMAQRVMIAIAIVGGAKLIIADEPTSALDVSVQAQILKLLRDLRDRTQSSLVLITHDLGVAAENCDRIVVMYAGQIVEEAPAQELFRNPGHPYTQRLLEALPTKGRGAPRPIAGSVPDLVSPPPGCRFVTRCPLAVPACSTVPAAIAIGPKHFVACVHASPDVTRPV